MNWKGFEKLVAAIHQKESEGADVKWNDTINGRQFDVAIRFRFGLHTYLTVIECRHHAKPIEATDVDAFVTKSRDASANKAIIVTSSRYQTGCFPVAERHGIELYTLKQIDDLPEDLFLPETIEGIAIWGIALVTSQGEIRLPDEDASRLQFIVQNARLSYKGQTRSLADVLDRIISSSSRELSREEQEYPCLFEPPTVIEMPDIDNPFEQRRHELRALTCRAVLTDLRTTRTDTDVLTRGVDPRILAGDLEYTDATRGHSRRIPPGSLGLGADTVFVPGHFYRSLKFRFSYHCDAVNGDLVAMLLLEGYQHGQFLQVEFTFDRRKTTDYQEIEEPDQIERLGRLLASHRRIVASQS